MARGAAARARQEMIEPTLEGDDEQAAAEEIMAKGGDDEDQDADDGQDMADLVAALRQEEAASVGMDGDQIASEQILAFERYIGKDYGDEIDGQSRVHTREVFETIEWMRPDFMRMFGSGSKSIDVEPWPGCTQDQAEDARDMIVGVVFGDPEQLDGHALVDDFFFDGALQKIGVGCVEWEEAELGPPEQYECNLLQAQQLQADPNFEILNVQPAGDGQGAEVFTITAQKVVKPARGSMRIIPPEDFRLSKRATNLVRPPYCGDVTRLPVADVIAMWPDKAEEIEDYAGRDSNQAGDGRRQARYWDTDEADLAAGRGDGDEIELFREYMRWDQNGDEYPELLEVFRIGDLLLEAKPVDDNCYFYWTPIRIPHRAIGMSVADITADIQRTNTVHLRNANNASALAVAPRVVAHGDHVNLNDLLNVRVGAIIRMKQGSAKMPGEVLHSMTTPDLAASALQMMAKMDALNETRTGVTRHAQGLNPDVLNKTMGGIDLLQNAAAVRKEAFARNMAAGLGVGFTKLLRLYVRHGDGPQQVKVGKQYKTYQPSLWSDQAQVCVHVGQGTGNRQVQIGQLTGILQQQKEFVAQYGLGNPIVTPNHLHNTIEQITRAMGFNSADAFFADPKTVDPQALAAMMAPKPDPKAQAAMQQMQADMQKFMQQMQLKMQELVQQGQLKREQMATEAELAREETATDAQIERERMVVGAAHKAQAPAGARTRVGGDQV